MIETQNKHAKRILSIEMIARIIKKKIQDENRKQMKLIEIPTQGPFINIVINIINQFLNKDDEIWKYIINQLNKIWNFIRTIKSNQTKYQYHFINSSKFFYYFSFQVDLILFIIKKNREFVKLKKWF